MTEVESLRAQLRERGYLTHGIERWFALDPWSSRTFWQELLMLGGKAATLISMFAAIALTAVMFVRNQPLEPGAAAVLFVSYGIAWFIGAFALVTATGLLLKFRPALPVDTPRALLAIALGVGALLVVPFGLWWWRFDAPPAPFELFTGTFFAVVLFLVSSLTISAALLSFSIHEIHRIPAVHQVRRRIPMALAALLLIAVLFLPSLRTKVTNSQESMVVVRPAESRVVLLGVDGLTAGILRSRPELLASFSSVTVVRPIPGESPTERWASLGTGVPPSLHAVRAIEGVRLRGSSQVIQRISRADALLLHALPRLALATRQPLPSGVRRHRYVWEILADRGVRSVSVNWWATADGSEGALTAVGPESVFSKAKREPLRVDLLAAERLLELLEREQPRFGVVYLPSLDVVLNRAGGDRTERLTESIQALDGLMNLITLVRAREYEVIVAGLPGDDQRGDAVIASTLALEQTGTAWDAAPTLLDLFGFPASSEMPGRSLAPSSRQGRVTSFGSRRDTSEPPPLDQEYYENLRSLGYIR